MRLYPLISSPNKNHYFSICLDILVFVWYPRYTSCEIVTYKELVW